MREIRSFSWKIGSRGRKRSGVVRREVDVFFVFGCASVSECGALDIGMQERASLYFLVSQSF